MKIQSVKDLEKITKKYRQKLYNPDFIKVNIGMASCGIAAGAMDSFEEAQKTFSGNKNIQICQTGCIGFCEEEPLVEILSKNKPRIMYRHLTKDKIVDVINEYMENDFEKNKKLILGQIKDPRSLLEDDYPNPIDELKPVEGIPFLEDIPFYKGQVKIALRNCGYIDPDNIEEYITKKGYLAFLKSIDENKPKNIIKTITIFFRPNMLIAYIDQLCRNFYAIFVHCHTPFNNKGNTQFFGNFRNFFIGFFIGI